jgi:hypothetical protein
MDRRLRARDDEKYMAGRAKVKPQPVDDGSQGQFGTETPGAL